MPTVFHCSTWRRAASPPTADVAAQPDQIVLTADYAYVRSVGEAMVTMLPLAAARAGRLDPVRLPLGSAAPQTMPRAINNPARR